MIKRKSRQAVDFIDSLHSYIVRNPQFRRNTAERSESSIQAEIRPLIIQFLEEHFKQSGYVDYTRKANASFYWEGQEGSFETAPTPIFGSRNYPDFIITNPYKVAVEYKQSASGALVKQAIGQAMMNTMSGDFHYAYILFHDQNKDKKIEKSSVNKKEVAIMKTVWEQFNVRLKFV